MGLVAHARQLRPTSGSTRRALTGGGQVRGPGGCRADRRAQPSAGRRAGLEEEGEAADGEGDEGEEADEEPVGHQRRHRVLHLTPPPLRRPSSSSARHRRRRQEVRAASRSCRYQRRRHIPARLLAAGFDAATSPFGDTRSEPSQGQGVR